MLQVVLDRKSLKDYAINAWVLQDSIFGLTLILLNINDLPHDIAWYNADDIVYIKWDEQDSDLQEKPEFLNLILPFNTGRVDWG